MTKVYPIARGTGPLFVTVISILLLGVVLNKLILISIFLICFGIFFLGISDYKNSSLNVIKFSIITGLFIGSYSLVDGYGARVSNSAISLLAGLSY